ncbi:MAG: 6-phosphogluconolactonase [Litoreibacter sp.]|nr:6-phosphogluconolactonase [Litoreibacter sp.]
MKFVEYADQEMMMIDLANQLAEELEECLLTHDHASFAVPGGTTPGPIFDALCAVDIDWSRVHVMLTDERWAPESSDRSNAALIKKRLLTDHAAKAVFMPFYTGDETPEAALQGLCEALERELPLSIVLLGMGADMHTASLFPGADRLTDALAANAPPLLPMRAPGAPEPRVTLTAPVLSGALSCHIVITGQEKLEALDKATDLDPAAAPVKSVLPHATVHWAP